MASSSWAHDNQLQQDKAATKPDQELLLNTDLRQGNDSNTTSALNLIDHPEAGNLRKLNADRSTLNWQARWHPTLESLWALRYDRDREQLTSDQAWLRWEIVPDMIALQAGRFSPAQALAADEWGRSSLRDTLLTGGHDHWHDTGVSLQLAQATRRLSLSALRGESNPGTRQGNDKAGLWLLAFEQDWGPVKLGLTAADTPRVTRQNTLAGDGHSHSHSGGSGCQKTQTCLIGDGQWLELAAQGKVHDITVRAAAGSRKEQGTLASPTGTVDYAGQQKWLSLETTMPLFAQVDGSLRYEHLAIGHTLTGTNAGILAQEAGISDSSHQPKKLGARLRWQPSQNQQLSIEWQKDQTSRQTNKRWLLRWQHSLSLLP